MPRRDGVRYIEVRYAPVLNTQQGLSLGEAVEAPLRGLARAERECGAIGRVIVCGLRNLSPDVSMELAKLAVSYKDRGVVAFDLAGGESAIPRRRTRTRSRTCASTTSPCTCHAGEGDGASIGARGDVTSAARIASVTRRGSSRIRIAHAST